MKAKKSLIFIGLVAIVAIAAGTVIGMNFTSERPINKKNTIGYFHQRRCEQYDRISEKRRHNESHVIKLW
jgi:hypothetical protein